MKFRAVILCLIGACAANAAVITVSGVTGVWNSAVASNPNTVGLISGVGTSTLSWGQPTPPDPQSAFLFAPLIPPNAVVNIPPSPSAFFDIGQFTHQNFQVGDNSFNAFGDLTAILKVDLTGIDVDGNPVGVIPSFLYQFALEETPNLAGAPAGCAYGGTAGPPPGCNDRVVLTALVPSQSFFVNGVQYDLELRFVVGGNPVSQFITEEFKSNSAILQGRFVQSQTVVPEPQTYALIGIGLMILAYRNRRALQRSKS